MRAAILDFGTNTFNLLIAEKSEQGFRTLYSGKEGVKLGKGGINKGMITPDAMERGFLGISNHMSRMKDFDVDEIHAYATSAMRNAANGKEFAEEIKCRFGFETNIIDGEEEASLIYEGIMASVSLEDEVAMIMDIGGGSVEFIICDHRGILWKRSFELGMARIIDKFRISDPISKEEIDELESYFADQLQPLFDKMKELQPSLLIGASGSFDTLAALMKESLGLSVENSSSSVTISEATFEQLYGMLIASTTQERLKMPGMELLRVEMIVPATVFINFVYRNSGLEAMKQSAFALKEGVMSRLIKE